MTCCKHYRARLFVASAALFLAGFSPLAAAIDVGIFTGYSRSAVKDNGSSPGYINDNTFRGMHFGASAHYHHPVFEWLTVGAGPYLAVAPNLNYSGEIATAGSSYTNTGFSIGAELQARFTGLPIAVPYIKTGFGSEAVRSSGTFTSTTVDTIYAGSGYRLIAGTEVQVFSSLFIFAEAGIVGAWYDVTIAAIGGLKAASTGFVANLGIGYSFMPGSTP